MSKPVVRAVCALLCLSLFWALPAGAARRGPVDRGAEAGRAAPVPPAVADARRSQRARWGTYGLLSVEPGTGTPRALGRLDGLLTAPSTDDPKDIALGYVRSHARLMGVDDADLAGLRVVSQYTAAGIRHVAWAQEYRGIRAIDTSLAANVTTAGRLVNLVGAPRHDLSVSSITPEVSASAAYAAAAQALRGRAAAVTTAGSGPARPTEFAGGGRGHLVIYEGDGAARLGWRLRVPVSSKAVYDVVVDATTGAVARRHDLVHSISATRYENYPGAPVGGTASSVSFDAYLTPGATTLSGPYAHTVLDVNDRIQSPADSPSLGTEVAPASGNWNYALTPFGSCTPLCTWDPSTAGSWQTNAKADATQVHWFVSNYHDHLANTPAIGFTAAAGAFENSDPVLAQSLDGANTAGGLPDANHVDNANMTTYPDGTSPQMQMYLTDVLGGQSTGFDSTVIYHEYTHGLIGRTITDADGYEALGGAQGGAINEGTADWYALDYVYGQGLETDGAGPDVIAARFTFGNLRSEPTDCPVAAGTVPGCPGGSTGHQGGYTYADFGKVGPGPEVHDDGEIWTQTMWQLRSELIALHGPADGVARAERLMTDGMRLSPANPSFLDLRNAILQADAAAGFGDAQTIWHVFAQRGMGYFASTTGPDDTAPVADFTVAPSPGDPTGTVSGTVTDSAGAGPLAGVEVAFAGHDSGVGPELSAATDGSGAYAIAGVPAGTYKLLRAQGPGYVTGSAADVAVGTGTTTRDFSLRRNLAAASGGATIKSFTGPDYTTSGCGPAGLIDGSQGSVWGSTAPSSGGTKTITVTLPATTTVGSVEIDPGAGCGDDDSASLGQYQVQVSPDGATFTTVASGTFHAIDDHRYNAVTLTAKPAGTHYVRLRAMSTQGTSGAGAQYMDVSEMRVFAEPGSVAPPTATTSAASGIGQTSATVNGTVNPNGTATAYQFEYGTTTGYGSAAPASPASAGSGSAAVPVSQALSGLAPGTTYHFRVVAVRGATRVNGADGTFVTTAEPTATTTTDPGPSSTTTTTTTPADPLTAPVVGPALAPPPLKGTLAHRTIIVSCARPATAKPVSCTVRIAKAARRLVTARLARGKLVVARATRKRASAKGAVRLTGAPRRLAPGRYRITIAVAGRRARSYRFSLA